MKCVEQAKVPSSQHTRDIQTVLGATAAHAALLAWALRLVTPEEGISLMWLPDGFLLGVLVLAPLRLWPALLLSITASSAGTELLLTARPLAMVLGLLSANLVESVGGAIVVRTLAGGRDALRRFRDLAWFLGACVVALPATSAPLVIVGARRIRADGWRGLLRPLTLPAAWLSMVAVVTLSSSVGLLVPGADLLLLLLGLPLLSWTAITTGLWGGLTVSAVLVVAAVQLTALGIGPYSGLATSPALALVQFQSYLGAAVVVSLFTSLAVEILRRTSRELERSRELLHEVVHSLDAGVVVYSPAEGVVLHNPSATAILEGPVEALFEAPRAGGWSVMEDEEATAMGILQQVRATRGPVRNLLLSRTDEAGEGRRRWVLVNGSPRFHPSGTLERLTLALIDVTELRHAQDRLRQAATALESTSEGVLITDLEGTILIVNPAFTRISGFSREEAIGSNPRMLQSERHGRDFYQAMWRSLEETGSWRGEIWNRRRDGDLVPELLNTSVVRDPRASPAGTSPSTPT